MHAAFHGVKAFSAMRSSRLNVPLTAADQSQLSAHHLGVIAVPQVVTYRPPHATEAQLDSAFSLAVPADQTNISIRPIGRWMWKSTVSVVCSGEPCRARCRLHVLTLYLCSGAADDCGNAQNPPQSCEHGLREHPLLLLSNTKLATVQY